MAKSAYDYMKENLRQNLKENMVAWRRTNVVEKLDKPSDIGRARNLGYKDKKGFVVFRARLLRGGRKRPKRKKGRKSTRQHSRKTLKMSYQWVAEQRVARKHQNLEILNSYKVGKDGKHYFFEVIMVDPHAAEIKNDKNLKWVCKPENRTRAFRGLTSAGKKSRGLRNKGPELKVRPSLRAHNRQGK
ncbi:50S ribosomal protein L15e [Candidatus Woesearchaeota archaeon CG10_big_fil_rev_8_21_14_0_10_34_12]|nr:MAG: 50S ribosomal protein L15e [Candidatus Woesearchaeota archaeon CG10_big_fil_rev_8_21_14_0_10_34_12]